MHKSFQRVITGILALPYQLVIALYFAYSLACLWFELRSIVPEEGCKKQRDGKIDFIRIMMHLFIIMEHVTMFRPFLSIIPNSFQMCVFALLSGIFGSSVDKTHLASVCRYTLGTILMLRLVLEPVMRIVAGVHNASGVRPWLGVVNGPEWYLASLWVWRFTVSPFFALTKHFEIPMGVPLVCVFGVTFFCKTQLAISHDPYWDTFIDSTWVLDPTLALMPYFAIGLCRPASWWLAILEDRRLQMASVAFCIMWGIFLAQYATNAKAPNERTASHMTGLYMLEVPITLACIQVLALAHSMLQHCLPPRVLDFIHGCGSRAIYGYILHWYITVDIQVSLVAPRVDEAYRSYFHIPVDAQKPLPPVLGGRLIAFAVSLHACFTWCSTLTEHVFGWIVMPYWMKNVELLCLCIQPQRSAEGLLPEGDKGKEALNGTKSIAAVVGKNPMSETNT